MKTRPELLVFRVQAAFALLAALLGTLTLFVPNWMEAGLKIDLDGGSGAAEAGLALSWFVSAAVLSILAARTRRRSLRS